MDHLWQAIRQECIDIVEWTDDGSPSQAGTVVWRFDRHDHALRLGSQLIVREGQWAVFVNEGRITDSFGPGRHVLATRNLPILTSLLSLPFGGASPFKAEVYFVATHLFTDLKWGTRHPLIVRDPELGPVRLRGFGSFTLRVNDPSWLIREVTGNRGRVSLEALSDQLRNLIVSRLADALGQGDHAIFDLAGRYDELARDLRLGLLEEVQELGLEIPSLLIENLTLPAEVEAALDRRSSRVISAGGGRPIRDTGLGREVPAGVPRHGDDDQLPGSDGRRHRAPPLPPPLPPGLPPGLQPALGEQLLAGLDEPGRRRAPGETDSQPLDTSRERPSCPSPPAPRGQAFTARPSSTALPALGRAPCLPEAASTIPGKASPPISNPAALPPTAASGTPWANRPDAAATASHQPEPIDPAAGLQRGGGAPPAIP